MRRRDDAYRAAARRMRGMLSTLPLSDKAANKKGG
jgi:hypothetical protein